jgi:hypothetical protein
MNNGRVPYLRSCRNRLWRHQCGCRTPGCGARRVHCYSEKHPGSAPYPEYVDVGPPYHDCRRRRAGGHLPRSVRWRDDPMETRRTWAERAHRLITWLEGLDLRLHRGTELSTANHPRRRAPCQLRERPVASTTAPPTWGRASRRRRGHPPWRLLRPGWARTAGPSGRSARRRAKPGFPR